MNRHFRVMPGTGSMAWQFLLMASIAGMAWYGIAIAHWTLPAGWERDICRVRPGIPWQTSELFHTAGMWLLMMMPTVVPCVIAINRWIAAVSGQARQLSFIGAFCIYCLVSAAMTVLLELVAMRYVMRRD
jgi:hypothetical protein